MTFPIASHSLYAGSTTLTCMGLLFSNGRLRSQCHVQPNRIRGWTGFKMFFRLNGRCPLLLSSNMETLTMRLRRLLASPAGLGLAVAAGSAVAWIVLRNWQVRAQLAGLVTYRYPTPATAQRLLLAPRSTFLAGVFLAFVLGTALLLPTLRRRLFEPLQPRDRWITLFAFVQCVLAVAVSVNLFFYVWRTWHAAPWHIDEARAMNVLAPVPWNDAQILRRNHPPHTRIALQADEPLNRYLMVSFAYPLYMYDLHPKSFDDALSDQQFMDTARKNSIELLMRYVPENRKTPFETMELPKTGERL